MLVNDTIQYNTIQYKDKYHYSGVNPVKFRGYSNAISDGSCRVGCYDLSDCCRVNSGDCYECCCSCYSIWHLLGVCIVTLLAGMRHETSLLNFCSDVIRTFVPPLHRVIYSFANIFCALVDMINTRSKIIYLELKSQFSRFLFP